MKALRFLNVLCLLALLVQVAAAQDFHFMSVQGNLSNADGNPLNGEFGLDFAIYRFDIGGSPLLRESQTLTIVEGFFNTTINVRPLRFDASYWVGISVNGGDELTPRLPLFPAPYSFSTRNLFGESNTVPSTGNAGFGTLDPQAPLHVVGGVLFEGVPVLPLPADTLPPFLVLGPGGLVQQALPGPLLGGGFNGMLQGVPLIVKDAAGNEVFRVNPDGTSFHAGEEKFAGGITLVDGVLTFPDGSTQETAAGEGGGGEGGFNGMLNNTPLIIKDADGDDTIRLDPDGKVEAAEAELEQALIDAIEAEQARIMELQVEQAIEALQGLNAEGDVKINEGALDMLVDNLFVGGLRVLPTPGDERIEARGDWEFENALRAQQAFIQEIEAEAARLAALEAERLEADEIVTRALNAEQARFVQELLAEDGVNITGGLLTFPDGSTQSSAGGFDGMLQGVPLIVKDAAGNEVFRVNTDGSSVHEGLETFNGGLVAPVPGVGEIEIGEFGVLIPLQGNGAISLSEDGISMIDQNGDEVFRVNPDGTSSHAGQEMFSGGIVIKDANGNTVVTLDENGVTVNENNKRIQAPAGGLDLEGPFQFTDPPIFEDGFESGDTSVWGSAADVGVDARTKSTGVRGENVEPGGTGVHGKTDQPNSVGVLGEASDASSKAGQFNGNVEVNGNTTLNGDAFMTGNATLIGDADMTGNATLTGTATLNGDAFMTGNATLIGDMDMTGNATLDGDAFMTGNATLIGDADMTGNATLTGNLNVNGDPLLGLGGATLAGDLTVNGIGQFNTDVFVNQLLQADVIQANTKNFKIDHPLDPAGQYLVHTSVESPDMLNVYNGNVVLDADGAAWVEMPSYFEALNRDFRYQLTCIGGFAPVYVAEEMAGNRFKIAGGTPGMKVSWQVTGVRHDPYARAYRSPVEVPKPAREQGTYLHPELYGASPQQPANHAPGADGQ